MLSNKSVRSEIKLTGSRKDFNQVDMSGSNSNVEGNYNTSPYNISNKDSKNSPSKQKLIDRFIKQNKDKYKNMKNFEEEVYKYRHSKPPVELNDWKFNKVYGDYFSSPKVDKVYSYKQPLKETFKNKMPFLRTKVNGDYFNKIDLSSEYDKYIIKN